MVLIRRWWPALLLVVLGVGCGVGAAFAQPPVYTAEARLVVGESSLSANMIPGFAQATQEIASNYARFVTKAPVVQALSDDQAKMVKSVSASPIPSSNIVRIEAAATSESVARQAATEASNSLVRQVAALSPEQSATNTLTRLGKLSRDMTSTQEAVAEAQSQIGRLQADSDDGDGARLAAARERLAKANSRLSTLQAQQNALNSLYQSQVSSPPESSLQLVNQARVVGNDTMSRLQLYGLAGAGIGAMIGLLLIRRRDRKATLAAMRPTSSPASLPEPLRPADTIPPELVHLDAGQRVPAQATAPQASARMPVGPSDHTQPLAPGGGWPGDWDGQTTSGRRRATDGGGWSARLKR